MILQSMTSNNNTNRIFEKKLNKLDLNQFILKLHKVSTFVGVGYFDWMNLKTNKKN